MQRHTAEARVHAAALTGDAGHQFTRRLVQPLTRHEHRGNQPVRQRTALQQRQRASRGAQALFAPPNRRETEVMPPVVGLERDRPPRSGQGVGMVARPFEHEAERGPRVTVLPVEAAGFARMVDGRAQGVDVGCRVGPRHLELQHAGIRETDVRRRVVGHDLDHPCEDLASAQDLFTFQRFERRPPVNPGPVRGQQRFDGRARLCRHRARHVRPEPVALARHRLDVRLTLWVWTKGAAQSGDRLLEAVVGDGDIIPACGDQRVFRDDDSGMRRQVQQHTQVAVAEGYQFAVTPQPAGAPIEFEGTEGVNSALRHGPDCTGCRLTATCRP